jgi:hypothetical protein
MGTWDVGPFNNDTAADWCGDLHDAGADQRLPLVRATLGAASTSTGSSPRAGQQKERPRLA